MNSKFLLLLGVSGVGKSTIMGYLRRLDPKFVYISPYITRQLRFGEKDKVFISDTEMDKREAMGEFLVVNPLYGIRYATPRQPIQDALMQGLYPLLDWPISKMAIMQHAFPNQLHSIYIEPPSLEELQRRLNNDDRDADGHRLASGKEELLQLYAGDYDRLYDARIIAHDMREDEAARAVYDLYLMAIHN